MPAVLDDAGPDNLRAIRCYRKAGFREVGPITNPDDPAVMLVLDRESLARTGPTGDRPARS